MTGRCHDQLKESCFDYIMQIIRGFKPSTVSTRLERSTRREELLTLYPFAGYASQAVMTHANTALDLGLTQKAFLDDALPWDELNILQESDCIKHRFWGDPTNSKPWYKAYTVPSSRVLSC